mgnify:FL=1
MANDVTTILIPELLESKEAETHVKTALSELIQTLYALYFVAHAAHWTIEGTRFVSLHHFFGELYEDVFGSIDGFAEAMRQHDLVPPLKISMAGVDESAPTPLLTAARDANLAVLEKLAYAYHAAEASGDMGLSNRIQDRLGIHRKWHWQITVQLRQVED